MKSMEFTFKPILFRTNSVLVAVYGQNFGSHSKLGELIMTVEEWKAWYLSHLGDVNSRHKMVPDGENGILVTYKVEVVTPMETQSV